MKRVLSYAFGPVAVTVGLVILLSTGAIPVGRALAVWLLCLAAVLLVRLVRDLRAADADSVAYRFDAALRDVRPDTRIPEELVRMEQAIVLGVSNSGDAHRRLVPLLRTAAAARLESLHGIDLARSPAEAQARLGDEAWDLLRPDRPEPVTHRYRGVPRAALTRVIAKLEAI